VKAAEGTWKLDKGDTLTWPKNSVGAEKNTGVANAVSQTKGAIGYVDFADAKKGGLAMASVKNAAGEFVAPTLDGASKAVAASEIADDLTFAPANAAGTGVYPITAPTWVLVYAKQADSAKGNALKAYLQYLLSDGQKLAPTVDYAPLPTELATKATDQLAKLQIG
jgi:phosphate transport system substrate-binding protein